MEGVQIGTRMTINLGLNLRFQNLKIRSKCKLDENKQIVTIPTQPQLNSKVGCDTKMTLVHPPPPHQLNVSNISAVTDPILTKL